MSFAFGCYSNLSIASFCYGLTDAKSKTSALYVVVKLNKALEHSILLVLRDTSTSILAIEVYAVFLLAISQLDVALMGVLDGICGEVGQYLLDTSFIECSHKRVVWIVLDELYTSLVNTLGQRLADVIEYLCKVNLLWFDGQRLSNIRCLKDIVDKSHKHVAVIADNTYELHSVVVALYYWQKVAKAHDGIKWRTYLVSHVGKECSLHLS